MWVYAAAIRLGAVPISVPNPPAREPKDPPKTMDFEKLLLPFSGSLTPMSGIISLIMGRSMAYATTFSIKAESNPVEKILVKRLLSGVVPSLLSIP